MSSPCSPCGWSPPCSYGIAGDPSTRKPKRSRRSRHPGLDQDAPGMLQGLQRVMKISGWNMNYVAKRGASQFFTHDIAKPDPPDCPKWNMMKYDIEKYGQMERPMFCFGKFRGGSTEFNRSLATPARGSQGGIQFGHATWNCSALICFNMLRCYIDTIWNISGTVNDSPLREADGETNPPPVPRS